MRPRASSEFSVTDYPQINADPLASPLVSGGSSTDHAASHLTGIAAGRSVKLRYLSGLATYMLIVCAFCLALHGQIARAFMIACSRSVLASLWFADAPATTALMERFYREVGTSGAPDAATAIFQAKAAVRNTGFDKPHWWSPFILIGDPNLVMFARGIPTFRSSDEKLIEDAKAAYEKGDYSTAFSKFKTLADQHNPIAQYVVGSMYDNGYGVPEDDTEAVRWYKLSAGQGYAIAQDKFGFLYDIGGDGVPKDYVQAVRWFRLAAAQGLASAQRNLGSMYALGTGVTQDYKEALRLFQLAAAQGDAAAYFNIGNLYSSGTLRKSHLI